MSGAESSYAKFSDSPLVRGSNSNFEPALFNKVGGIRGCTGATNNVAAANSDPGYNYKLVGGSSKSNYVLNKNLPNLQLHKGGKRKSRKHHKKSSRHKRSRHRRRSTHRRRKRVRKGGNPFAVPSEYAKGVPSFGYEGADLSTTSKLAPGHAPITVSKNTACSGGAKRRRRTYKKRRNSKKSLKKRMKSRRKKCCPVCKRYCKKSCKCNINKSKKYCGCKAPKCKTKRKSNMKGGYSQFLSNVPYSASYSTGGVISPSDLALANPVPHQRFINCPQK